MKSEQVKGGFVFKGLKPVNWCFDCGSALAEAEVEYEDKKSSTIDVAFPIADDAKLAQAFGLASLSKPAAIVIWTTTPWTIPANQALNVHPEFTYALVDVVRAEFLRGRNLEYVKAARALGLGDGKIIRLLPPLTLDANEVSRRHEQRGLEGSVVEDMKHRRDGGQRAEVAKSGRPAFGA